MPPEAWNPGYDHPLRTYLRNTQHFKTEDDYFAAQTVRASTQMDPRERRQQAVHALDRDFRSA